MIDFPLPLWELLLRLTIAAIGGAVLGYEREKKDKPAGLRTNMMVSLGAASFTLVTMEMYREAALSETNVPIDPSRAVAGIIGGIGFLGAGAIMENRNRVRGITTASAIWVSGAIGVAGGCGYYTIVGSTVAFAICILAGLGFIERKWLTSNPPK